MRTRVGKWDNSLAVRIPKTLATAAHLQEHSHIELTLENGQIVITTLADAELTLEDLLAGVTPDNLHGEWNMGDAVGKEIW